MVQVQARAGGRSPSGFGGLGRQDVRPCRLLDGVTLSVCRRPLDLCERVRVVSHSEASVVGDAVCFGLSIVFGGSAVSSSTLKSKTSSDGFLTFSSVFSDLDLT